MDKDIEKKPIVSIILPTLNGGSRISSAIESVFYQSFSNWEILIIDDGSIDNTKEVVKEFILKDSRVIYLKNEKNLGIQKSLNKGLKEARGIYIARIDDDDEWIDNDKIKKQVEFLETNPEYVLVGTGVIVYDEIGVEKFRYLLPSGDNEIRERILSKNCFVHSSVMFRKENALLFGGYSEIEISKHLEDYDLWLRLGTNGKFSNIPSYSVKFVSRKDSLSSIHRNEMFKKSIKLISLFKRKYPNYLYAVLRSLARFVVYGFIIKTPLKYYLDKITKIYKES